MAQHDMNIANQGFPATRADLNNALQALVSNSSGTSAPITTFANQWWYDTTNNKLYIRNEANNAWIQVAVLDQTNNEWQITTGQISAADGDGLVFKTDDGNTRITLSDGGDVTFADGTDIITATAGTDNVRLGQGAGDSIASGALNNVTIGKDAGTAITTGDANIALGKDALKTADTCTHNVALGFQTLFSTTSGGDNTAVGNFALYTNTATRNTSVGYSSLYYNSSGANNTAVGYNALLDNTTGGNSVAIGHSALANNLASGDNTAVGMNAGLSNTSGNQDTFVGTSAGRGNTTGLQNVYVGANSGYYTSSNRYTTFVGMGAGQGTSGSELTGSFNTATGYEAGFKLQTTARTNTFLGAYAGYYNGSTSTANGITTGTNNTCVGFAAYPSSATVSDEFTLGDGDVSNLRCNDTSISSLSDERDKTNIVDVPLGLDFIKTLRPVAFDWNRRDGKRQGVKDFGFIAQELKTAQDATDYADHMRLVHTGTVLVPDAENTNPTEHEDGNPIRDVSGTMQECLEADPMKTYPVLIKAVQELSTALDAALARIAALEA